VEMNAPSSACVAVVMVNAEIDALEPMVPAVFPRPDEISE
jgi:hypothetical protein